MQALEKLNPPQENTDTSAELPVALKPKRRFTASPLFVLGLALGLAVLMWAFNFQPVNSDTTKLVAVYDSTANLLDPNSPVWNPDRIDPASNEVDADSKPTQKVSTTVVPLSAQYLLAPQGGSILNLQARAAWNGNEFAVRVSWKDPTKNVTGDSADQTKTFSDAVAVEFPLEELIPGRTPFRCMGQSEVERRVNIWQWKAERDPAQTSTPIHSSPGEKAVKNYVGPGPGYLIDPVQDDPDSKSFYNPQDQTWTVIFKRSLLTSSKENSTQFTESTPGNIKASQIAFAVWDGGNGERLSKKAVSTWVDVAFEPGDTGRQFTLSAINLGIAGGLAVIVLLVAWFLLPNTRRSSRS